VSNDRRKNSRIRHTATNRELPLTREPMPLDPMEQRNAERIKLEQTAVTVLDRLAVVQDTLNNSRMKPETVVKLLAEKKALRSNAIGILSQLIKL